MLRNLVFALVLACFTSTLFANGYEVLESVCKVHAGNSLGTGTCIDLYNGVAFVFTNYHVVSGSTNVTCQFYTKGHESVEVPGKVVWTAFKRNDSVDMAIIGINAQNFGDYKPKVTRFGSPNKDLDVSTTVITAGCPEGKWPALVKGHVIQHNNGVYYIKPPVENGRSGSALLNEQEEIVGIITWRTGNNYTGQGMAQDLRTIYAAMTNQMEYRPEINYQHPHWKYNGFLYSKKYSHLPEPKPQKFAVKVDIGCPDCRPFNYGYGPDPGPYNPQRPSNPYPDGGRLFPTLPGGPNPNNPQEPTPAPPEYPDYSEEFGRIEEMFSELENSTTEGFIRLEESISSLSEKVENNSSKIKDLEDKHFVTPGHLEDKNYITPGHLEDYAKKSDVESIGSATISAIEEITSNINGVKENVVNMENNVENVENNIQNVQNHVNEIKTELSTPKEVGMEDYAWLGPLLNGLGISIPSAGILGWVWWLLGRKNSGSGGPQAPFPINQNWAGQTRQ